MLWTQNAANLVTPRDDQILAAYKDVSGYKEGDPNTDNGAVELEVLTYWRNNGIAGRAISAFMKLNHLDENEIKLGVHLMGGCYVGVLLPDNFEDQMDVGKPWSLDPKFPPNPANGHAVPIVGYDTVGVSFLTWGQVQKATWEWVHACMDEAFVVLSPDFFNKSRQAPNAFDMAQLQTDLGAL